jgi:hypothetical protein
MTRILKLKKTLPLPRLEVEFWTLDRLRKTRWGIQERIYSDNLPSVYLICWFGLKLHGTIGRKDHVHKYTYSLKRPNNRIRKSWLLISIFYKRKIKNIWYIFCLSSTFNEESISDTSLNQMQKGSQEREPASKPVE